MSSERKTGRTEAEEMKEIFSLFSAELPGLIKNILNSVFSEEAGKNMGKAAVAYYKELKNGGLPDEVAIRLTEEYMRTFTSLSNILRNAGQSGWSQREKEGRQGRSGDEEE